MFLSSFAGQLEDYLFSQVDAVLNIHKPVEYTQTIFDYSERTGRHTQISFTNQLRKDGKRHIEV